MDPLTLAGSLFSNLFDFLNKGTKSKEEIEKFRNELNIIQVNMASQIIDLQKQAVQAQKSIVMAEVSRGGWLQRNWRPITMLTFLILVVMDSLGILQNRLTPEMWMLLQIGMGGYVVGRSFEKTVPSIIENIKR